MRMNEDVMTRFDVRALSEATWRDRRTGVASAELEGALDEIARLGGGTVAMFERQGLARTRRLGKRRWLVTRVVP